MGTEEFYARCGYREVGRIEGAIRVAPGGDRDDILMARRLDGERPAGGATTQVATEAATDARRAT